MKKITLLCFAMVTFTFAFAQQKGTVIKTNPLSLAVANLNVSVEKAIGEQKSFQMHAAYWLGLGGVSTGTKFSGFFLTPEFRFYVTDYGVPQGFYVAPFARFESLTGVIEESSMNSTTSKATLSRIGGGVGAGYQFFFGDKVTWDFFLGPKFLFNSVKSTSNETVDLGRFGSGFGLRGGTTIGIAF